MMFGPHDSDSDHSERSKSWGIKRKSNDELRQEFVNAIVPQARILKVTLPDKDIKWIAKNKSYDFGKINWEEFWDVVNGNGPCNNERLEARRKSWEEGAWVREAATAYSKKREITNK